MIRSEIINQGEGFVTIRESGQSAAELADLLRRQGIRQVYKGDQNQLWDAVIANQCLASATEGLLPEGLVLFIQDEKMGTPDARLRFFWRLRGEQYALTEDYYGLHRGAVWEHQDVTYGLFFTEPVDPASFARAGVTLSRAAELWARYGEDASRDRGFLRAMESLGVSLDWRRSDSATRLGPPAAPDVCAALFAIRPEAGLFFALTRSTGLYGVVPTVNNDVTTSSIPAASAELREKARWLLVNVAARGAMRTVARPEARRAIKERARRLAAWADRFLEIHPGASIAEFQAGLAAFLWSDTAPESGVPIPMPPLTRTSQLLMLGPDEIERVEAPAETPYFFLDLALRHPAEFAAAYNEALLRVGFGLQRVKHDPLTGRYQPPFFVEYAPEGDGTPVYRFSLEIGGARSTRVTLANRQVGTVTLESPVPVRSAAALFRLLFRELSCAGRIAVAGKAAPFAAELMRWPASMAMPRQGSKYAPMLDHLIAGLNRRGVLNEPSGLVLRIGINGLDTLAAMGGFLLRVPRFLQSATGERISARDLAASWRQVAERAQEQLRVLQGVLPGQHVHVARVLAANACGRDLAEAAAGHAGLARFLGSVAGGSREAWQAWQEFGADVSAEVAGCLDRLLARRDALLAERRRLRQACPREVERERAVIECQLLLIYAAYVRRLCQQAESLPYLNDRPYSLSLWLLFGPAIFRTLVARAEFDVEYRCEAVAEPSCCCGGC
jgi:hypothetical protein